MKFAIATIYPKPYDLNPKGFHIGDTKDPATSNPKPVRLQLQLLGCLIVIVGLEFRSLGFRVQVFLAQTSHFQVVKLWA